MPSDATAAPEPQQRLPALAETFGERAADAADGPLDRFLAEPDCWMSLRLWVGSEALPGLAADRRRLRQAIDRDIAAIDALLTDQVNAIIHAPRFLALEAAWRGLLYLLGAAGEARNVKIKLLQISWNELVRDVERAPDFDQSEIFDKVYSNEFGIAGGEPFGLLLGDYEVSHRRSREHPTDDVTALNSVAQVAAAAFAPFVVGCRPDLFGLGDFRELSSDIDLDEVFRQAEYTRWRSLRNAEDCRFVGICLPRILLREPWRDATLRRTRFRFQEQRELTADNGYLWGNAGFAFAGVAIRAFIESGWFAEIRGAPRGVEGGGLVGNLPVDHFTTDRAEIGFKRPLDIALADRLERVLSDWGFIPLSPTELTPYGVFFSNQSIQLPVAYSTATASMNAKLSSMLQYMLCIGRFAHVIKVLGRDRVGSFTTPEECQSMLQRWVTNYVTSSASASVETRIRYPLREAQVRVTELPGKPGSYKTDIHLRPHLQLDDIATGIRLTTELAPQRAA